MATELRAWSPVPPHPVPIQVRLPAKITPSMAPVILPVCRQEFAGVLKRDRGGKCKRYTF